MKKTLYVLVVSALMTLTVNAQSASKQWLHVHVQEASKGDVVKINVPLALAEAVLPVVQKQTGSHGHLRLNDSHMSKEDLQEIWAAVRAQGDADFVTVETRKDNVRVSLRDNYLIVRASEESKTQVDVMIPAEVVDALLSGPGDQLDLLSAIRALEASGSSEIVSVRDRDTTVRVWIDERN
jgi:hypothetical protein